MLLLLLRGWVWPSDIIPPAHEGPEAQWGNWLLHWEWRADVILVLVTLGVIYSLGWWRLRGHHRLANGWRLASYWGGLAMVGLALLSPIDVLQSLLFTMHMLQHELLMMAAPPLLLLANPLPFFLWGLPEGLRHSLARPLAQGHPLRRVLRLITAPQVAWVLYVATLWGWHSPAAYDAALHYRWIHDLEHLSFFLTALLFWWHVTGAAPRLHGSLRFGLRIGYVLAAFAQNEILAVAIALAGQPLYSHYITVPRLWGLSVMDDQALGGTIMWVPGGMMYALTTIILVARLLDQEEKKARRAVEHDLRSLECVVS